MNARTLLTLTTLIITASFASGGKLPPSATFEGTWAGVRAKFGPGATGGSLTFSPEAGVKTASALSANATPITGSVTIPNLKAGGFDTRAVTGYITPKGRVRAKFKGGFFNGHLDRLNHGATGFMLVNLKGSQFIAFWYADDVD